MEQEMLMCRNIKPLFNYDPPVSDEEVREAALQFVRKISGTTKPSKQNQEVFERAVDVHGHGVGRVGPGVDKSCPEEPGG